MGPFSHPTCDCYVVSNSSHLRTVGGGMVEYHRGRHNTLSNPLGSKDDGSHGAAPELPPRLLMTPHTNWFATMTIIVSRSHASRSKGGSTRGTTPELVPSSEDGPARAFSCLTVADALLSIAHHCCVCPTDVIVAVLVALQIDVLNGDPTQQLTGRAMATVRMACAVASPLCTAVLSVRRCAARRYAVRLRCSQDKTF